MASRGRNTGKRVSQRRWDVFISHASEDKTTFVEPLAVALREFGLKVWYDRFTLSLGDSLSKSIDEGLAKSRFGLVVLSSNFLIKGWTEYELRGLISREIEDPKVILPVWHNITKKEVLKFSPPLADKLAVNSLELTPLEIAVKIIEHIRPELFQRIARRRANLEILHHAKTEFIDPRFIKSGPKQHTTFTPDLIGRIRLIRASFFQVRPDSMESWVDDFKRDAHPSREVAIWEHMASVYMECCAQHPELSFDERKSVYKLVVVLSVTRAANSIKSVSNTLPSSIVEEIFRTYGNLLTASSYTDTDDIGREKSVIKNPDFVRWDTEHFPKDVPDHLIEEIILHKNNKS